MQKLNIDPKSESPSLESLVDDYSMFIFLSIGITRKNLEDFFALPPEYRLTQSSFQTFKQFSEQLTVVNDPTERAIGMMQTFIKTYESEDK